MSSEIAIRVEGLGKRYRIGGPQTSYKTIRESLTDTLVAPFKRLSRIGQSPFAAETLWALKDVSFEIKRGEVVGIIGRNGAGKSTLLKILSRITEPTEGWAEIHGRVGSLLEVGTGFHPELTGRENIYLNGAILGMRKTEIDRKFDEIVAFAEVEKFIDTPVKHYSSGMYVRLAFAVAAHLEPEILLVDEVLAVGDVAFQKKCLGKLDAVAREGRTILFVSHNMAAITSLCPMALWLDTGKVSKQGDTYGLVRSYEESCVKQSNEFDLVIQRPLEETRNKKFFLYRVSISDVRGNPANAFRYKDKVQLRVESLGDSGPTGYSLEFRIYKQIEGFATMGASGAYCDQYFDRHARMVLIEIGPLTLTSGKYTISLSAMTGSIRADAWDNACTFHVIQCEPFARGRDVSNAICIQPHAFSKIK